MKRIEQVSKIRLVSGRFFAVCLIGGVAGVFASVAASAEKSELVIAQQSGVGYIPMMIAERRRLIQKHAQNEGLGEVSVKFVSLGGGSAMNTSLLSQSLDIAAGGLSPALLLWDKTNGAAKLVAAVSTMPEKLTIRNEKVRTIADLGSGDKIALPAVKVSDQARFLQMAAAKMFGIAEYARLDKFTVSLSHPDGFAAISSNQEINGHFTVSPYQEMEQKLPGAHTILSSYEVMGGPITATVYWTTSQFRDANPKLYRAFLAGLNEGIEIANRDKLAAAELYVEYAKSKLSAAEIHRIISNPDFHYSLKPHNVERFAEFLNSIGVLKRQATIEDIFFPEVFRMLAENPPLASSAERSPANK